jgi:hypothetical protein
MEGVVRNWGSARRRTPRPPAECPHADVIAVGRVLFVESHTVPDDPTRPLDQAARLIIDHEGHVTVEVSEAARRATPDLKHSSSHPRRHRLRSGERHASNLPTVRIDQNPRRSAVPIEGTGAHRRCLRIPSVFVFGVGPPLFGAGRGLRGRVNRDIDQTGDAEDLLDSLLGAHQWEDLSCGWTRLSPPSWPPGPVGSRKSPPWRSTARW